MLNATADHAEVLEQSNTERKLRAAIYARVSSYNQLHGYSIEEQVRLCRERCRLMGWEVKYIFKDEAVSGGSIDRPMFQRMLEKAMSGAFDVIVFWKLDRFCRSLVDLVNIERQLREWGVALHSVTEQIDTTTPVGRFNFRNLASAAELERDLIRERARMGMHALARQKRWPNKSPPLGYDLDDEGRLKVNHEEAKLVRRIFELYIEHKSMAHVAYLLNKSGIKTKKGKKWTGMKVKEVLDNEIYRGKYRVAGIEDFIEDYKIIDDDTFNKAKSIRNKNRRSKMQKERKCAIIERIFEEYLSYVKNNGKRALKIV